MAEIEGVVPVTQNLVGSVSGRGNDGISPVVEVTEIENGYSVSITDLYGTKTYEVHNGADGVDGLDGVDGVSPKITTVAIDGGHEVTIQDAEGEKTFTVMNGEQGIQGIQGIQGETGKSAYQYAVEGGYQGTEAEFTELLYSLTLTDAEEASF